MMNNPVMGAAPLLFWNHLHQRELGFFRRLRVRQPDPVGDAKDVGVNGDRRNIERL